MTAARSTAAAKAAFEAFQWNVRTKTALEDVPSEMQETFYRVAEAAMAGDGRIERARSRYHQWDDDTGNPVTALQDIRAILEDES